MKKMLLGVIIVAVATMLVPQPAFAGTMTLEATTDVWIRDMDGFRDTTFEDDLLSVWSAAGDGAERNGAVTFDLSGVTEEIVGAYLSLYESDYHRHNVPFEQQAASMVPIDVSSLTWNALGSYTITPLDSLGAYNLDGTETKNVYQDSEAASAADVAVLEAIRLDGGSISMLLTPANDTQGAHDWGDTGYSSTPPQLVLTVVPEPGAIALVLIGMVALVLIRRK